MVPLVTGGISAALVGRARRVTPLLAFEVWTVWSAGDLREAHWTDQRSAGWFVAAATLIVLAYAVNAGYAFVDASISAGLAIVIGASVLAILAIVAGLVACVRSSAGRLTLLYVAVFLGWCAGLPLLFLLASPWNLVLVLAALFVGTLLLSIFCARLHASMQQNGGEHAQSDVRLVVSETRFPRHMARWLLFGGLHAVVYTLAFVYIDSGLDKTIDAIVIAHLIFVVLLLLWTCACRGPSKTIPAAVSEVLPVANKVAAGSTALMESDSDDDDVFVVSNSNAKPSKLRQR